MYPRIQPEMQASVALPSKIIKVTSDPWPDKDAAPGEWRESFQNSSRGDLFCLA